MSVQKPKTSSPAARTARAAPDLYDQPGHLIRRAHQIATGMFVDLVSPDVTPIQYALLQMIETHPGVDQVSLAQLVALDTSTTALTAARLATRGLITRSVSTVDRRQLQLALTAEGAGVLDELAVRVQGLQDELLGALEAEEREVFLRLLQKFVHLNNENSRAPQRTLRRGA